MAHTRSLTLGIALLAASCGRPGDSAPRETLRPDGFGPVRVGMSLAEASAAVTQRLPAASDTISTCRMLQPHAFPTGVTLMLEHDTVVRIDVETPAAGTDSGVHVGDSEAAVRAAYHDALGVQPQKYNAPPWRYLIFAPRGDTLHRIVFESDGQHIRSMRAGRRPAVDYTEKCG